MLGTFQHLLVEFTEEQVKQSEKFRQILRNVKELPRIAGNFQ